MSSGEASSAFFGISKLNSRNYQIWKFRMEALLDEKGLWDSIDEGEPPKEEKARHEWEKMDRKAKAIIRLMVDNSQINIIRSVTTAKATWDALKSYHEKVSLNNKSAMLRQLINTKLSENGNMELHINTIMELAERLKNMGRKLADDLIVAILLSSLPKSYDPLITALDSRPDEELTLELVTSKLINQYTRQLSDEVIDTDEVSALKVEKNKYERKSGDKGIIRCFFCNKEGHFKANCREFKKWLY